MSYPLGRRQEFDPKSRGFAIRTLLPDLPLKGRSWACSTYLDQGSEGSCVGNGWSHELAAAPVAVKGITEPFAFALYKQAQTLDQWDGEAYEGTSVLAGAKAVKLRGYMPEYRWAFGIDDVLATLSHYGPVVLGLDWLDTMFDPAPSGLLDCSGSVAGGHCILARGLLLKPSFAKEPVVRLRQSWNRSWGRNGDCFIRASDLETRLLQGGEGCVPVRRSLPS